jgi:hypothetical protein
MKGADSVLSVSSVASPASLRGLSGAGYRSFSPAPLKGVSTIFENRYLVSQPEM